MKACRWLALPLLLLVAAGGGGSEGSATTGERSAEKGATKGRKDSPVGRWRTIDDETGKPRSIVRIWEEDGKLYGKVEKIFLQKGEPPHPVCENCEGALEDEPIVGMTILRDLERDDGEWSGGTVLDPKNGKEYSATIRLEDGGRKLKLRGYLGISLFGRSQTWERVQ